MRTRPTSQLTNIQILEHPCAEMCDQGGASATNRSSGMEYVATTIYLPASLSVACPSRIRINRMCEEVCRRGDSGVKEGALSFEWMLNG
jgi:hypothetical protein